MQFIDLHSQYERIRERVRTRIDAVLEHGEFILGPEIAELETKLAAFCGCNQCVSCASGTDALLMALMAMEIGPGDAVFVPAFTFIASAEVIAVLGAMPVFVDIDPSTFNIDVAGLRAAIERTLVGRKLRPRAVIPVDLFGLCADYDAIGAVASEHGLFVIEDAAQAFGASYKGKKACSLGGLAATSFFPAKPLGCYGDGGALFTASDETAARLRSIRMHGKGADKYDNVRIGINGRLDTIQAAVLLAKLEVFGDELGKKQEIAQRYSQLLDGCVTVPVVPPGFTSAWAQYTIRSANRDIIMGALKKEGVPSAIYYPTPLHLQTAFRSLGYARGDMPAAEKACADVLSLPMHAYLKEGEQKRICEIIQGRL